MPLYRTELEKMVYEQKQLIDLYTKELKNAPAGHLVMARNHGKRNFYWVKAKGGKRTRKAITRDPAIQRLLARKAYAKEALGILAENIRQLDRALKNVDDLTAGGVLSQLSRAYRCLPEEYFVRNDGIVSFVNMDAGIRERLDRHREWAAAPYEKSAYRPEGLKHLTSMGFRVRSKSELMIVEQLAAYPIPFHYEELIQIGAQTLSADFTFEDAAGGKFYWEHAGMMDVPAYEARHFEKLKLYRQAGIVPWKNLIVTYDSNEDLNLPFVKEVIRHQVIPRL